jgi:hypothetical protein
MKKKLITLMTAIAILASQAVVFADEIAPTTVAEDETTTATDFENNTQEDIVLISDDIPVETPSYFTSYISNTVTVSEFADGKISAYTDDEKATESELENVINFTTSEDTFVISAAGEIKSTSDIKADDKITVYTSAYAPAPLILPVEYRADVIVINDDEQTSFIDVDTYVEAEETIVNVSNTLALNIDDTTAVIDKEGNKFEGEIANNDLVVIYSNSTRSIPAQTTPATVIVLGENEEALAHLDAAKNEESTDKEVTDENTVDTEENVNYSLVQSIKAGDKSIENIYFKADENDASTILMVPLREVAETLGFTVEWDGDLRAVVLNNGIYSLKIDENSYVKGKMAPVELSVAPEIKDDLTYVPVEYFTEILEAQANNELNEDGNVTAISFNVGE